MITVITASLPSRAAMLAECIASIAGQTMRPFAHLVAVDTTRAGSSAMRNMLLVAVRTEWTAILDDDDVAFPDHLEALLSGAEGADVVYTLPTVEGRGSWQPVGPFDPERLLRESYIPATALVRTNLLRDLRGWRHASVLSNGWEDWDLWLRALADGARFAFVPRITWRYRFHGGNKTTRGEANAT